MTTLFKFFPRAFWILLTLHFASRIAASVIWPFLNLLIREQTGAPLTQIAALLSIQSVASLLGTSLISTVMDRFGRKRPMIAGMVAYSLVLVAMSQATMLHHWAILIALYGATQSAFSIGVNAMVADIVEPAKRTDAYAIVRMVSNASIAIGPVLGGVLITQSRMYAYLGTASINFLLTIPVFLFLQETLTRRIGGQRHSDGGFGAIVRDTRFVLFCLVFGLLEIGVALVFSFLGVYIKENFGLPESDFGLLVSINAIMVVFLQYGMTRVTRRFAPYRVLSAGAVLYSAGLFIYALSSGLPQFALGMAVLTLGELMVTPTATAQVANMAPANMRARYMGIFSILYMMGAGIGPLIGSYLSETIAPNAIWYGGAAACMLASVGFVLIPRLWQRKPLQEAMVEV